MQILPFASQGSWAREMVAGDQPLAKLVPLRPEEPESVIPGGVIRGEREIYAVVGRAGQTLGVRVAAAEDNAAFDLYLPGSRIRLRTHRPEVCGRKLNGEGNGDCRSWTGTLPATGPYLVVVGATRGNASYELSVALR